MSLEHCAVLRCTANVKARFIPWKSMSKGGEGQFLEFHLSITNTKIMTYPRRSIYTPPKIDAFHLWSKLQKCVNLRRYFPKICWSKRIQKLQKRSVNYNILKAIYIQSIIQYAPRIMNKLYRISWPGRSTAPLNKLNSLFCSRLPLKSFNKVYSYRYPWPILY